MSIRKIEVERLSVASSKPFDAVASALKSASGTPDMAEFWKKTNRARNVTELRCTIEKAPGKTGLMLFAEFDHGAVLRKDSGRDTPRIVRFGTGNPLTIKEIANHVPDAGAYAPVTVLVDERADGVHLSYDRMTSFWRPYENSEALAVAENLDANVEILLRDSAR